MSDFRPDTKGAVVDTSFFFKLTCSVTLWGRRDAADNTGVCSQCLSHTGPAPAHGACSLPDPTAQALGCSARNHLRPALGCMHLPGLSRSDSGTRVVLRGAVLCLAFCTLPRSEQLRWWGWRGVWQARLLWLIASPPLGYLGVQPAHLLRQMLTVQNPKKF